MSTRLLFAVYVKQRPDGTLETVTDERCAIAHWNRAKALEAALAAVSKTVRSPAVPAGVVEKKAE